MNPNDPKQKNNPRQKGKKITSKQIVALAGVILLVLMYVSTLAAAILDTSASGRLFAMCIFATIAIPILIWIYVWMYGKLTGKKTMADFKPEDGKSNNENSNSEKSDSEASDIHP